MFINQLFLYLTRVLQQYGEYAWNFETSDPMYGYAIYSIYKVTVNNGYDQ